MHRVIRIESLEEAEVPFPSLEEATQLPPRTVEACITTSLHGVRLAEAAPGAPLRWVLTSAGRDVVARYGWTRAALPLAPREDFEAVSS